MKPELDWAVWLAERQRRVEDVLDSLLPQAAGESDVLARVAGRAFFRGRRRR